MKKFIYFLAALMALSVTSCKEDDITFNNVDDLDRLPMPMFRKRDNTNISDESDMYASKVMDGRPNAIQLHWFGVEGAAGYEIRYAVNITSGLEEDWRDPSRNVTYVTLPADQLHYEIYNLEYSTPYRFCIRALHPTDPSKNSNWYGMGDGRQWEDYMGITTDPRYATPVVVDTREKDYDAFTVLIDTNFDPSAYNSQDADTIRSRFQIDNNGRFKVTHLIVKPSPINPLAKVPAEFENYELSDDEIGDDGIGQIRVTGLDSSALYLVALRDATNPKAEAEVDTYYNYATIRTRGDAGPDILIPHRVATSIWKDPENPSDDTQDQLWFEGEQAFQACRIDTVIANFNSDFTLAEGQTFLLEGGKAYYVRGNQSISKGFTLKTDPADILAGKGRAKVYLGGIARSGDGILSCNWNLGKELEPGEFDVPIKVENIIFQDIDFDCPLMINFGGAQTGVGNITANYFANMYSQGMGVEFDSFQMLNCTFQGFCRGFFRVQGNKTKIFHKIVIDNCVFFNQGYYDNNGRGYSWIAGAANAGRPDENLYEDFQMTNNTFYDCPRHAFISDNNVDVPWNDNVHWNIRVENNTFINVGTRSTGRVFFDTRYVPGGSKISFKRNLIVTAADENDHRNLYASGMDLRNINGTGELELDIRDNYSAGCRPEHLVDDGILTNNKFSANRNSAGAHPEAFVPGMTATDLLIKVGSTPLRADELFNDPNPVFHAADASVHDPKMHWIDPENIWTRLQYKNDLKVTTHEIYVNNIGDQRWKTGDPKWYYPAGSPVPTPGTPAE